MTTNSVSQPISLSAPIKIKGGKPVYRNPFEDEDSIYHYYHNLWSDLNKKFKLVNERFSKKFINDITEHIKSYKYTSQLIPALALLTGVNVSDHDILFDVIKQEIKSITRYPVVFVQSHHDLTVKPVVERMVQSFLTNSDTELNHHENDQDQDEGVLKKVKKSMCTFTRLQLWYESKKSNEGDRTPLVIIIPDVESFCSRVLNEFFSILSVYKIRIPFIIILGIATDLNALHQRISPPVLQDFDLTIFKTQPSLKLLDFVLEEVFLTAHCPFQLHGKMLEELIDAFTFYNFSVEFFIRGIQFCMIHHFWNSDNNILCCPIDRVPVIVKSLASQKLDRLLKLPSVCTYNKETKNKKLASTRKNIKDELVSLMEDTHDRISRFHVAVHCFYVVVKSITNSDFKTLREIYCQAMQVDVTKTEKFKQCMIRFKFLSFDTILENINTIEKLLHPHKTDVKIEGYTKELVKFRCALEKLDYEDKTASCSPRKRTLSLSEISATTPKNSPKWESINSKISPSPRKRLSFGDTDSPHKRNTITLHRSPKKEQVDPLEDISRSPYESFIDKEEVMTPKTILSPRNSAEISHSPLKSALGKKKLKNPEKQNSPHESCDLNTTLIGKIPFESPGTPVCSKPVNELIASACAQSNTPIIPVNVPNGLYTPPSRGSRSDFQKTLRTKACQQKKRSLSAREQWKLELVEFLTNTFFKEMLECPANYTFHEIFMYKDLDHVKNNFISVNQRNMIEKALQDPHTILKCKCCKLKTPGDTSILMTFPDLCITYKLLLERSSEDVDTKSLLTSFDCVATEQNEAEDEHEITSEVYNRFRQSLKDLELMGYIKPHKTKPDVIKKVLVRMK